MPVDTRSSRYSALAAKTISMPLNVDRDLAAKP
jgi:hypothetical protein